MNYTIILKSVSNRNSMHQGIIFVKYPLCCVSSTDKIFIILSYLNLEMLQKETIEEFH